MGEGCGHWPSTWLVVALSVCDSRVTSCKPEDSGVIYARGLLIAKPKEVEDFFGLSHSLIVPFVTFAASIFIIVNPIRYQSHCLTVRS